MQIKRVDRYLVGGQEFKSCDKARQWLSDQIGERVQKAIRKQGCVLHPRDEIRIVDAILASGNDIMPFLRAYGEEVDNNNAIQF